MAIAILLPLIVLSLGEIAVFILVGDAIGVWRTVALVFLSILAGLLVLRVQGVMTLGPGARRAGGGEKRRRSSSLTGPAVWPPASC